MYSVNQLSGLTTRRAPIAGLRFPLATAPLVAGWILGRVLYTHDYGSGDPKKVRVVAACVEIRCKTWILQRRRGFNFSMMFMYGKTSARAL